MNEQANSLTLKLDNQKGLLLHTVSGWIPVHPVRAFPVTAPDAGIALVDHDGIEQGWLNRINELPADQQAMLQTTLAERQFMPEISRVREVSSFDTPSIWSVDTHRGPTRFTLKSETDIQRIGPHSLLVQDQHSVPYLIRDLRELDRTSLRLLDRFM